MVESKGKSAFVSPILSFEAFEEFGIEKQVAPLAPCKESAGIFGGSSGISW